MAENLMTVAQYCKIRGLSRKQFYEHKRNGALKGCFRRKPGGKRQLVVASLADKALETNVRQNRGGQATRDKFRAESAPAEDPATETDPATEEEVRDYLSLNIGELAGCDISMLQKYNELEKLLLARIKRRRESGELIEAETVERQAFEAARAIRDAIQAIPDRLAAILAAETETFRVKQLLSKEIQHVLENLTQKLNVSGG